MKSIFVIVILTICSSVAVYNQIKPKSKPVPKPTAAPTPSREQTEDTVIKNGGTIRDRTYSNTKFGFDLELPEEWYFAGRDFEAVLKEGGIDLSIKTPRNGSKGTGADVGRPLKDVEVLFTAFHTTTGSKTGAILRVAAENLASEPSIKDAVDYFDAIRATYKTLPLPADFTFSETQAEQLGAMQFAFLDTRSKAGKKRIYATVRDRSALIFALSYSDDTDLTRFRRILEEGNFSKK